ncbi:hypothetical protein A3A79_01865 [Candidatus Gottesmanbacteria bacterium RIFCSPLOWO2_01_FULL_43_11b]|uniref:Nucleotidyl transferase AbiEii/AbiGii toxin family protein n=1 Tax=Candidatus Gottesmanbacteria bacterium RIFCSPLOWO2_01_FULL_43_11b TaxID=1798392 RepID=A0A1F6AI30_9BACT|nr:MAG: hypothetical protein A3A79_01865 [Candidatus Gottesmanbacteria bacterium RIFCSPLOWO2_01_FULL_43_11b]
MGKATILTPRQTELIRALCADTFFTDTFYFTGGTALSEVYLKHRKSEDLDFFSARTYDPQRILHALTRWSKTQRFSIKTDFVEPTHIYVLTYPDGHAVKVDFATYPYPSLDTPSRYRDTLSVDSLFDIAVNKLVTITQRTEVKDFVDLYFLFRQFTFWTLRDGVKTKFNIEIDPYGVASNFMAVEDFDFLPIMHTPLTLQALKMFFRTKAKDLGKKSIAP